MLRRERLSGIWHGPTGAARPLLLAGMLLLAACGRGAPPPPPAVLAESGDTPAAVAPTETAAPSRLRVATFNLKFYGDEDDANNRDYGDFGENVRRGDADLTGKLAALVAGADIIALQEVENRPALDNFIDALNARDSARRYTGYMYDTRLPQDLALVWDAAAVSAGNAGQIDRRFRRVGYDGDRRVNFARLPLTADFTKNGIAFSVLVVHLKAKSPQDAELADARRAAECARLLDWLDAQRTDTVREHCLLMGDFNDVYSPDAAATGLAPLVAAAQAGRLRFLTADFAALAQYTSFSSHRNREHRETIDHIIIPPALADHYVAGSCHAVMHNDPRLSDHHPVLADFQI